MARTYIELPSSGVVDMNDDVPLSLNYTIADIRDPEKRDTSFSKTITIPGTKNNNKLFNHIFEIGKSGGFNPNIKTKAIIYVDTIPVFDGYLQLLNVSVLDQNEIEYDVVIFGKLGNIYTVWADDNLENIDFSDLSHTYDKTNIAASWVAPIGQGYVYPMIDYGFTTGMFYNVENFFPALFLKEYIDRIFAYAGYTYTSSFFNTDFFKRLIIPYNGIKLQATTQDLINRTFRAATTVDQIISVPKVIYTQDQVLINFDSLPVPPTPASDFNTTTHKWTVPKTGYYLMSYSLDWEITITNASASPFTITSSGIDMYITMSAYVIVGGQWILASADSISVSPQVIPPFSSITIGVSNRSYSGSLRFSADDVVHSSVIFGSSHVPQSIVDTPTLTMTGTVKAGSLFYNKPIADIADGHWLDFNTAIPRDVKIRQLFTSVIKAFNLYIEEDKNIANNLLIEPRQEFYDNGSVEDWTDKQDISKPVDIKPMGLLDAKDYLFTYKEDSDYWNELYKKTFNKIYGDRIIQSNNDFLVETKKNEIMFSPSPMVQIPIGGASDRIVPQIVSSDNNGNISPKTSNLRLLYWGGLRDTNQGWEFRGRTGVDYRTNYPYAGHLNDPINPTIDLCFGVPQQLFYIPDIYTNNNLYNVYYKKFISEITDPESKLVTASFRLRPLDILKLDFRNKIFVDGHYYLLNKIKDYNPTADDITQVELIKIKEGVDFPAVTGTVYTNENYIGDEIGYGYFLHKKENGNTYNTQSGQKVLGEDNYVDASAINVLITGNNNIIGANASGVTILNSSGVTVVPGISNVTVINSSGVTVIESNQLYQNGVLVASGASGIRTVFADYDSVEKDSYIFVDATDDVFGITIGLSVDQAIGKITCIKKIDASVNPVYVSGESGYPGSIKIDDLAYQTLSAQYDSITVIHVSQSVWYIIARV